MFSTTFGEDMGGELTIIFTSKVCLAFLIISRTRTKLFLTVAPVFGGLDLRFEDLSPKKVHPFTPPKQQCKLPRQGITYKFGSLVQRQSSPLGYGSPL